MPKSFKWLIKIKIRVKYQNLMSITMKDNNPISLKGAFRLCKKY